MGSITLSAGPSTITRWLEVSRVAPQNLSARGVRHHEPSAFAATNEAGNLLPELLGKQRCSLKTRLSTLLCRRASRYDFIAKRIEGEWTPTDEKKSVLQALDTILDEWLTIRADSDISPTKMEHERRQRELLLVSVRRHLKLIPICVNTDSGEG